MQMMTFEKIKKVVKKRYHPKELRDPKIGNKHWQQLVKQVNNQIFLNLFIYFGFWIAECWKIGISKKDKGCMFRPALF